jgi:hypothetical protein
MQKKNLQLKTKMTGKVALWLAVFAVVLSALANPVSAMTSDEMLETPQTPSLRLQAASGLTIDFQTQNGQTVVGNAPEAKEIPYLVLFRNGKLAGAAERTLQVNLGDLDVPASGLTVALKVETQHGDPDRGGLEKDRITVWEHSEWIPSSESKISLSFEKVFNGTTNLDGVWVTTPTDYFRTEVAIYQGRDRTGEPMVAAVEDFAFLMESQWVAKLSGLAEETPGAAPDELAVYYGDMFPFQNDPYDPDGRLGRAQVHNYIQNDLGPALVEAVRVQSNDWGFAWNEGWTSFRDGSDRDRLSVALVRGGLWFHGKAPAQAHGGISINLEGPDRLAYETLSDWLVSVFYHELFHNLQRNHNLAHGQEGDIDGRQEAWEFIAEGTAVVASSVGQLEAEFGGSETSRAYLSRANRFLAGDKFYRDDLKTSYRDINPYNTAIYWRFLYEQCSGPAGAMGDLGTGMQVIRRTLTELYAADDLAGISAEERVEAIPALMNKVFSKAQWCPFRTYEESLEQFSRAIYTLRLENGRCERAAGLAGCGFYDPNGLYAEPQVREIVFSGDQQAYESQIGSSYGMEFVEIALRAEAERAGLSLAFDTPAVGMAAFSVQLWKLEERENGGLARIPVQLNAPDVMVRGGSNGRAIYEIPQVDLERYSRLGLIITRLDSHENGDPLGVFNLTVSPAGSTAGLTGD